MHFSDIRVYQEDMQLTPITFGQLNTPKCEIICVQVNDWQGLLIVLVAPVCSHKWTTGKRV